MQDEQASFRSSAFESAAADELSRRRSHAQVNSTDLSMATSPGELEQSDASEQHRHAGQAPAVDASAGQAQ